LYTQHFLVFEEAFERTYGLKPDSWANKKGCTHSMIWAIFAIDLRNSEMIGDMRSKVQSPEEPRIESSLVGNMPQSNLAMNGSNMSPAVIEILTPSNLKIGRSQV